MADPKRSVESPDEKEKNGSKEKPVEINTPKVPEIAPVIAAEKTEVKKTATMETAEVKREVLQREINVQRETCAQIDLLDVNGNLESKEQKEGLDVLQTVTGSTLLATIFDQGIKKEALKPFESISAVSGTVLSKLNPAEKSALKKIQEIAAKPGTAIYDALQKTWDRLVDKAHDIYAAANKAKESLEKSKPNGSPAEQPSEKKVENKKANLWETIKGFASENPVATAMIAIGGAYGVYKIYKLFSTSKEEKAEKKPSFIEKIIGKKLKFGLEMGMGIFVLGKIIGNDGIRKWIYDNLGLKISDNRVSQTAILLSDAMAALVSFRIGDCISKIVEAVKVLIAGPEEHYDVHKRMAEKISKETGKTVKPETLKGIGNIKYDDFMGKIARGKSVVGSILGKIPLVSSFTGSAEDAEQENILRDYFEAHKGDIDHFKNPTTTVDDVLVKLDGEEKAEIDPEIAAVQKDIDKLPAGSKKEAAEEMLKDMDKKIDEKYFKGVLIEAKKINYDTKKLEELWTKRKQAWAEWQQSIQKQEDPSAMAEKAKKILDINEELGKEILKAEDEIMRRHGWTEVELLGATHAGKVLRWWSKPEWQKQYGTYWTEKYLKKPFGIAKEAVQNLTGTQNAELVGKEFKTDASLSEIEEDLKKTNSELATAKTRETSLKDSQRTGDQIAENDLKMNKAQQDLLSQDLEIHETRKSILSNENKLKDLKANNGAAADIAKIEKDIADERAWLRTALNDRLHWQGKYLETVMADNRLKLEKQFSSGMVSERVLTREKLQEMDRISEMLDNHRKQINMSIAEKANQAEAMKKEGKDVKSIIMEMNELKETSVALEVGAVKDFNKMATGLSKDWKLLKAMRGGMAAKDVEEVMKTEKNQMMATWSKIMRSQMASSGKEAGANILTTLKRNAVFYAPFIGLGMAVDFMDGSKNFIPGTAFGQAAIDTLPYVSTASDIYSAISGKEYISGRTLDLGDRIIRGGFFIGSLACDLTELAPFFMRGRAAYGAVKETRAAGKAMEIGEALRIAKAEKTSVEGARSLKEMAEAGKWFHKMALGGALGLAGYEIIYRPVANVELSEETMDLLGNNVKDVDAPPPPKEQLMMK